ncbi:YebC/PmpR family DNA-binding transcriptional regulator [bacterium]|nr:YebC/PmpR family DNA-binding transcriptional regulator [bacterium]|tara:strand:- start:334 stop:1035 length:702 start_codon:yes stop_codon:yes gene_type:complete
MSGHSKWHKIRHKKEATDGKKSKLFGQLSRDIKIAARRGTDPAQNNQLREAIERAKKMNLPQGNIDRLLSTSSDDTKSVTYEGYGPGGVALLIATETDSTNRTVAELRNILKDHHGQLEPGGSVQWKFSPQFTVEAQISGDHDEIELALIDAGADDMNWDGDAVSIIGSPQARADLEAALAALSATISSMEVAQVAVADQQVTLNEKQAEQFANLLAAIEEHTDVITVYSDAG